MLNALILFAQDGAKVAEKAAEKGAEKGAEGLLGGSTLPMLMLGLIVLFFFVVVLPGQRKRQREQEALLGGLKKNDEVVTAGGIIGVVSTISATGDEVTLKIDDNAKIRVLKSSILRIISKDAPKDAATPNA